MCIPRDSGFLEYFPESFINGTRPKENISSSGFSSILGAMYSPSDATLAYPLARWVRLGGKEGRRATSGRSGFYSLCRLG